MSKIRDIIRHDLRAARKNIFTMIVLFGLAVVPLIFTVFNVLASWDPFDNTQELKIAVASEDEGYKTDIADMELNLGDQVLGQLSLNEQIDWRITNTEDALEGTRSGEYYSSIILPPTFSKDMMTFYVAGTKPTELKMYTNQKKNSMAPMVTEQAASGAVEQINESFSQVVNNVGFGLIKDLNTVLTEGDTKAALDRIGTRVDGVAQQLQQAAGSVDSLTALVESTVPLAQSAERITAAAGAQLDSLGSGAGAGAGTGAGNSRDSGSQSSLGSELGDLGRTFNEAASSLGKSLDATRNSYAAVGDSIDRIFGRSNTAAESAGGLEAMANRFDAQRADLQRLRDTLANRVGPVLPAAAKPAYNSVLRNLDESIARTTDLRDSFRRSAKDLRDGQASTEEAKASATTALGTAKSAITNAKDSYETELKPQLSALGAAMSKLQQDVAATKSDIDRAKGTLSGVSLSETLTKMQERTGELAGKLNERAGDVQKLATQINQAGETGDLSELADMIGADPALMATHLAAPTTVKTEPLNGVKSFGAGMTPLYGTLALWVGALISSVVLHTRISEHGDEDPAEALDPERYTRTQAYLGRYGIFAALGTVQGLLMAAGLIFFVGISPEHPWLLALACWVASMVFMLIVYTLVLSFGNAGKALAVLLLVFQVSGSGGAYPLQLLPEWFQNMSPFLPASYVVKAFRAAIAGVYQGDYWLHLLGLLLFVLPTLLLGLVLRRGLDGYNDRMDRATEAAKVF